MAVSSKPLRAAKFAAFMSPALLPLFRASLMIFSHVYTHSCALLRVSSAGRCMVLCGCVHLCVKRQAW